MTFIDSPHQKKNKNIGRETTHHISQEKGDTLAQRAVSLLHQGGDRHHSNQDGMQAHFVALLCKGIFQSSMPLNCSR